MKKTILLLFVCMAAITAMSQDKKSSTKFSGGAEIGLPIGGFSNSQSFGVGGSVHALFGDASGFTASAGYMTFTGKTVGTFKMPAFNAIPVKIGYRMGISDGFYFEPQSGLSFTSQSGVTSTAFTYAPVIGIVTGGLDISARYEAMSYSGGTLGFLGVRALYSFGSKK